jgi:hypothetical protein
MNNSAETEVTWKTLWKTKHEIFPWPVVEQQDTEDPEEIEDPLSARVAQFYSTLVNPALDAGDALNILLPISLWNELIEEGAIKEYLTATPSEVQVRTGKLGSVDCVTFWTDAFSDDKAKDQQGSLLNDTGQYALIYEESKMNDQVQVAPAIAEMLPTSQAAPETEAVAEQEQMGFDVEGLELDVSPVEETQVSFIFGDKKETKAQRAVLNSYFSGIYWNQSLGGAKKEQRNGAAITFSGSSIAAEYDKILEAVIALIEAGSTKISFKRGADSKKVVTIKILKGEIEAALNREVNKDEVRIRVAGLIEE